MFQKQYEHVSYLWGNAYGKLVYLCYQRFISNSTSTNRLLKQFTFCGLNGIILQLSFRNAKLSHPFRRICRVEINGGYASAHPALMLNTKWFEPKIRAECVNKMACLHDHTRYGSTLVHHMRRRMM